MCVRQTILVGSGALLLAMSAAHARAPLPKGITPLPFVARDDIDFAAKLPVGTTGTAAIFADHVTVSHLIRRVQVAILDYVNPF